MRNVCFLFHGMAQPAVAGLFRLMMRSAKFESGFAATNVSAGGGI